jgi:putative oxidoreductase
MLKRPPPDLLQDFGLLVIRVIVGVIFIFHGGQKLFGLWGGSGLGSFAAMLEQLSLPIPAVAAVLAAASEFLGGMALVTGVSMRLATVPLLITMGVAVGLVHRNAFAVTDNGMEYALTLGVVLLGLALTGPGRFSLGGLLGRPQKLIIRTTQGMEA